MTIDEIETLKILQCTIPKIDIAKGIKHYEPFAEHVCIHNMKEKLDSKTYYFQMLCSLLEFHGFELNIINGDYDITQNTIEAILIGKEKYDEQKQKYCEDIINSDDVKSENEYQNLKGNKNLNDKENLKFHKCRIKRFFNNHIDLELVRLVVYSKGFVRKYMNQKRLLNKLVSRNLEDDEDYEKINFNKLIKDTDIRGDMEAKLQYYVNKILTIMKFKSIFDVMTEVDTEIAMQALRDNVEWFRQLYQLHHSEYEKEKRIEDMPSVHWTDKRWREYINVALNNEYGICVFGTSRHCTRLRIAHTLITPLLFDFDACEELGVDLKHVYKKGRTDGLFDTINTQYEAYDKFLKERGNQKEHVNLLTMFARYFEITNDAKHFIKSSDLMEWLSDHDVNISYREFVKRLKQYCVRMDYDNVKNKSKKINEKVVQVWMGIRIV